MKQGILIVGFGRIGKLLARALMEDTIFQMNGGVDIYILNRTKDIEQLKYLFKYDSVYGKMDVDISEFKEKILYKENTIEFVTNANLEEIVLSIKPDIIINSTPSQDIATTVGEVGTKYNITSIHTNQKKDLKNIIYNVNDGLNWDLPQNITASICDVAGIAAVTKMIHEISGIKYMNFMSVHPALAYQNILDKTIDGSVHGWHGQHNLSRSFFNNIIPKKTTAGGALEQILPEISGKVSSYSIRIPTLSVTMGELIIETEEGIDKNTFLAKIEELVQRNDSVHLEYDQITSLDLVGTNYLSVIYADSIAVKNNHIRICIFYDNEWGYITNVTQLMKKSLFNKNNSLC